MNPDGATVHFHKGPYDGEAHVFNQREPIDYDYTQVTFPVRNPDFGRVIEYQDPIQARVGLRFEF